MCSTNQEVTDATMFLISLISVPSSNRNSSGFNFDIRHGIEPENESKLARSPDSGVTFTSQPSQR